MADNIELTRLCCPRKGKNSIPRKDFMPNTARTLSALPTVFTVFRCNLRGSSICGYQGHCGIRRALILGNAGVAFIPFQTARAKMSRQLLSNVLRNESPIETRKRGPNMTRQYLGTGLRNSQ